MGKAGGIIGILAGVFGFVAAIITLFVGGLGGALQAEGAGMVVGLGWGGVLFSFLAIVFGAVAFARPRGAGIGLIVVSIAGAILGGTLVAVCMVLSLIGGILATLAGGKAAPAAAPAVASPAATTGPAADTIATATSPAKKPNKWLWAGGAVAGLLVVAAIVGGRASGPKEDPIAAVAAAPASGLRAEGDISAIFAIGSNNTDLQRENALKEISGQVVEWTLPVYEVRRAGNGYKVQTMTKVRMGSFGRDLVGTFVTLTPRSDEERRQIEALKTGDLLAFKGRVAGSTMRNLNIHPAILATSVAAAPARAAVAVPVSAHVQAPVARPAAEVAPSQEPPAANVVAAAPAAATAAPAVVPTAPAPVATVPSMPQGRLQYSGSVSRMEVIAELSFDGKGGVSGWWSVTNDPKLRGQRFRLEGAADDGKLQLREFEGDRHSLDVQLMAGDARLGSLRGKAYNRPPRSDVWEVSLVRRD